MNIAVIGTAKKENEHRVAIHPQHIIEIDEDIRKHLFFEKGYGLPFGMQDSEILALTGNILLERSELYESFKAIIIAKPVLADFEQMQEGTLVWGWIHTVQQENITQIAIDKKLTLIAWENMNYVSSREKLHIFSKNNEMAGYCGVQHALELKGLDGQFGPSKNIAVISHGSVSRGAIFSLLGHGFTDITVYTQRPTHLVANKIPSINYKQIVKKSVHNTAKAQLILEDEPFVDTLLQADIIVNGILQNPNNPIDFMMDEDLKKVAKPCLIIDVSCDEAMGFSCARPTTFIEPSFDVGQVTYYAVDHTPTLLWNSASWEISKCVLPYLKDVIENIHNEVLINAMDMEDGIIRNQDILTYQNRSTVLPYKTKTEKIA